MYLICVTLIILFHEKKKKTDVRNTTSKKDIKNNVRTIKNLYIDKMSWSFFSFEKKSIFSKNIISNNYSRVSRGEKKERGEGGERGKKKRKEKRKKNADEINLRVAHRDRASNNIESNHDSIANSLIIIFRNSNKKGIKFRLPVFLNPF